MCYAYLEIKYNLDKEPVKLKSIDNKEALTREIDQLEKIGTVAKVTVFLNHHTHRLVSNWVDELYKEPSQDVPAGVTP